MCIRDRHREVVFCDTPRRPVLIQPGKQGIDFGFPLLRFVQLCGLLPVSYTHLDVYKRQVLGMVNERHGMRLDGDAALALKIHVVEELILSLIHI